MRPTASTISRTAALAAVLALVATACSIQAPSVELIGQGGGGGGGQVVTGPGGDGGSTGGITVGGGSAGGQVIGGNNNGGGGNQNASSCLGKATDTGVTGKQITLGANFAASGPVSNISGPIFKGVTAYFNEVNAQGGIHGRKIKLKWYDDGWDAQKGKGLIKKLVEQDKVFVLTVVPSSNGLDAAKSYLESKQMPVFGTSGLIESQFRSPMQWPVGTSTKSATRISIQYMKERGVKNVAFIWLDLLAGKEAFDSFKAAVPALMPGKKAEDVLTNPNGYRVSISEADFGPVWARVESDTKDWQARNGVPQAQRDGRPDFVVFAIDPTNAIKALGAAQKKGMKPKIGWGGGAPLFLDLIWQGSSYAKETGLLAGTSFFPPIDQFLKVAKTKSVIDYVNAVRKYYGSNVDLNNPYLEGGYAGAALTVEILKRVGPCLTRADAIKVGNNIQNFSAAGLTKPLNYSAGNHYGNIFGLTVQVSPAGKWVVARDWVADPTPGKD